MVSCPELGGIQAMIQNVSVKHSLSLCTFKLAMDDSLCSEHARDIMANVMPSPAVLHGLADWVAERSSFSIMLSQLISEGLHTHCGLRWYMLMLADGVAPRPCQHV